MRQGSIQHMGIGIFLYKYVYPDGMKWNDNSREQLVVKF